MSDDDKLREEIARGVRAEALLNDELLTEAFETIQKGYLANWQETKSHETERREKLWQAHRIVTNVREHLEAVLNNGHLAKRQLDTMIDNRRRVMGLKVPF